jgi:hypothetical protein
MVTDLELSESTNGKALRIAIQKEKLLLFHFNFNLIFKLQIFYTGMTPPSTSMHFATRVRK